MREIDTETENKEKLSKYTKNGRKSINFLPILWKMMENKA